jgi:signal transduction histidine kinase/ActR/RegA family two-component response regulator
MPHGADPSPRPRAALDELFEHAPAAIGIFRGPRNIVELANPALLRIWRRAHESEVLGQPAFELVPELAGQGFEELLAAVRTHGKRVVGRELPLKVPSGSGEVTRYFDFAYEPLRAADGSTERVLAIGTDVTESVLLRLELTEEADAALRASRERFLAELQTADERKDEFLATLAHELRNPMAAISTALMLLESAGGDSERSARYHETARRQMSHLARMVDDLLDVARITRGKIELRREPAELARLVQDAVAAARPALDARSHQLTVTIDPGAFAISADATRIEQIVANLLSNAARYTEPGGHITVELRHETSRGEPCAALRVRDTGRGIPRDMLLKVFDPFTQVSPSIDRGSGGLGLGLTLVRRLVEMHDGSVEAQSEGEGQGSTFVVRLPLVPEARAREAEEGRHLSRAPAARRILLIDDSDDVREMLKELLESLGHDVSIAEDGLQGVERARELRPDVALVDIGLPGIDGYEVARRLHADDPETPPYTIALTGYGSPEAKARAKAAGFDLHMTKPVDLKKLIELIQRSKPRALRGPHG